MTTLPWLDPDELYFPPTDTALTEPNGLLAAGADLNPQRLLLAYQQGIFPWYEPGEPILWWSPSPRAVLFPQHIHISKSLNKRLKRQEFTVTCDQQFIAVIQACADTPRKGQPGTWISDDIIAAYTTLHQQGHAHSVEVWHNDRLVGGLYGINIGQVFFGESMFSHSTDASKIAFVALAQNLAAWGYPLIDCQVANPHLTTLGAEEIDRSRFNHHLQNYILKAGVSDWQANWRGPQHV
ncbi:leucyl/phenylalanyl-tRNA--protein transferase [Dasania sp. GY-MA-18]|uniref:Leucyl/phenylalanyl-tRNA--protein transferase n=1 Tax=Dasania phycosphaerae TaxID=2950436 RepID=A0A9J6RJU7_9GAMM|nr:MULTISPECIES: leucyl/phenylalanyl-tRNA--protein transferase [Dasania]MCR8921833.1 leucyl/phenylalanyl-tRNA--protein transferase [Dasania sp. GY-MA-18]MCZ0864261.1 leucyl/phenylalanyl-tRNA--protein transferase [Dasania phycosphaerae]MCZ0867989.1 leucyl/phenylalanyl-tRNA--protein transferase [Dasania phycosphaerae]